jgi:hypothetical protein
MKPLPESIHKNNLFLRQLKRTDHIAMYSVHLSPDSQVCGYEVFLVRTAKAEQSIIKGKTISQPDRELFPNNEAFGTWAWSWATRDQAERCWSQIEAEHAAGAPKGQTVKPISAGGIPKHPQQAIGLARRHQ